MLTRKVSQYKRRVHRDRISRNAPQSRFQDLPSFHKRIIRVSVHWSIWVHIGPHWSTLVHIGPYWSILVHCLWGHTTDGLFGHTTDFLLKKRAATARSRVSPRDPPGTWCGWPSRCPGPSMCNLYTELKDPLRADHRQFVLNDVTSLYNSTSIEDKANPESTFHKLLKKLLGRMSVDHASQSLLSKR